MRPIGFARFLPVLAQKLMSADQPAAPRYDLVLHGALYRAIGCDVSLLLLSEAEPPEHAQAVGFERKNRLHAREEQDLLRAGFADAAEMQPGFVPTRSQRIEGARTLYISCQVCHALPQDQLKRIGGEQWLGQAVHGLELLDGSF